MMAQAKNYMVCFWTGKCRNLVPRMCKWRRQPRIKPVDLRDDAQARKYHRQKQNVKTKEEEEVQVRLTMSPKGSQFP